MNREQQSNSSSVRGAGALSAPIDVLLLFPYEPRSDSMIEPAMRKTVVGEYAGPILQAFLELEAKLNQPLSLTHESIRPYFGGVEVRSPKQRSLGAVILATHLELSGLSWYVCDPGERPISSWRQKLAALRELKPRVIGISSTFINHLGWLGVFLRMVREMFPKAHVVLGGAAYLQNPKGYLALDADAFCVGEGEQRFPAIVKAIRDGGSLASIPGLYLPRTGGGLEYTGKVEPLNLSTLPAPDWSLVDRIDPPLDLERDLMEIGVETQRGCGFKCAFCTYRSLNPPTLMAPEEAAKRILSTAAAKAAFVDIVDATATYPWGRWNAILDTLIEAGGSPRPLWCMARVTDLHDATVERMVKANVRHVFVGQESGDQRILNAMRKGTNISAVRPAVEALSRHGLTATLAIIHGFPGETQQSLANSRQMLLSVNEGLPARPAVLLYSAVPYMALQIATATQEGKLDLTLEGDHFLEYRSGGATPRTWSQECLKTFVMMSRCRHAPATLFALDRDNVRTLGLALAHHQQQYEIFRWMKLVEFGAAMFLAERLGEDPPSEQALDQLRRDIGAYYEANPTRRFFAVSSMLRRKVLKRVVRECSCEADAGPGVLTRLNILGYAATEVRSLGGAVSAIRFGTLQQSVGRHAIDGIVNDNLADMAKIAIDEGLEHGRSRRLMTRADGRQLPLSGDDTEPNG